MKKHFPPSFLGLACFSILLLTGCPEEGQKSIVYPEIFKSSKKNNEKNSKKKQCDPIAIPPITKEIKDLDSFFKANKNYQLLFVRASVEVTTEEKKKIFFTAMAKLPESVPENLENIDKTSSFEQGINCLSYNDDELRNYFPVVGLTLAPSLNFLTRKWRSHKGISLIWGIDQNNDTIASSRVIDAESDLIAKSKSPPDGVVVSFHASKDGSLFVIEFKSEDPVELVDRIRLKGIKKTTAIQVYKRI